MVASWMVDGEALVMMAVMISSNSPSRQGAKTKTSDPDLRFRDDGGGAELCLEICVYSRGFLGHREDISRRGGPGATRDGHTTPRRGQGWARAWARCGPPVGLLLFSFRLREILVEKHLL